MRSLMVPLFGLIFLMFYGVSIATESIPEVAHGIYLLPGQLKADKSPDGNSEILVGKSGIVVIDTGRNDTHTEQLIAVIEKMQLPLAGVFNTHWHLDHIGGNAQFKKHWPAVPIFAHPSLNTALNGFHRDYRVQLEQYLPTLSADSPEHQRYQTELDLLKLDRELSATDTISESTTKVLGGRHLEINVTHHAVTEGDIWIWDPATRTIIAGDLVTLPVPLFDSACPEGWKDALDSIAEKKFETLIPGHGAPMKRSAFEQYRSAYNELLACAVQGQSRDQCVNAWFVNAHNLLAAEDEPYGRTLLRYYFDQFIRPGASGRKRWCVG
jgi:glyoxylase-like metal-dependent hydrolase (beta-lactamase superfamily II)